MIYEDELILPTNDIVFKEIFWNKEYPEILISFINSILKRDNPITSVELLNTEISNEFIGERGIRLDLVARASNGELLNIEMQKKNSDDMYKRSLYYLAKLYSSQLQRGDKYNKLCPVITINILDFNLFEDNVCNRSFVLKETKSNEEYLRMIEMHFIELGKRKYIENNEELFAWTEFLRSPSSKSLISRNSEVENILKAKEIFNKTIADPIQKEKIRLIEKTERDNLAFAASAHDEGLAEGVIKGRIEGLAEGLKKGKAEGEHNAKIETARNFLRLGLSVEQVSKGTGLTIEEIKELL